MRLFNFLHQVPVEVSWLIFVSEQNWDRICMAVVPVQSVHYNYHILIIHVAWSIQIHQLLLKQRLRSKLADLPFENQQVFCLFKKNTLWPLCGHELFCTLGCNGQGTSHETALGWGCGMDEGNQLSEVVWLAISVL